jgi:phosphosulfolactate synthase (CoM biosynthesis protein A)
MKQTAVEWLVNELKNNGLDYIDYAKETIDKAKEMEKEQIIDAYAQGFIESEVMDKGAEQYYNQKYKQD